MIVKFICEKRDSRVSKSLKNILASFNESDLHHIHAWALSVNGNVDIPKQGRLIFVEVPPFSMDKFVYLEDGLSDWPTFHLLDFLTYVRSSGAEKNLL